VNVGKGLELSLLIKGQFDKEKVRVCERSLKKNI